MAGHLLVTSSHYDSSMLLMICSFTVYSHVNCQLRRWRCCVGSWTLVRWQKTTCWSIPWPTLSAASWPPWRTSTPLWPPEPGCYWTPSRGRHCRWPAQMETVQKQKKEEQSNGFNNVCNFMLCFVSVCFMFYRACAYVWTSSLTLLWGIDRSFSANSCCYTSWRKTFLLLAGSFLSIALKHYLWRPSCTWTVTRSSPSLQVCCVCVASPLLFHSCFSSVFIYLFLFLSFMLLKSPQPNSAPVWVYILSLCSHHSSTDKCSQPQWRGPVEDTTGTFRQE